MNCGDHLRLYGVAHSGPDRMVKDPDVSGSYGPYPQATVACSRKSPYELCLKQTNNSPLHSDQRLVLQLETFLLIRVFTARPLRDDSISPTRSISNGSVLAAASNIHYAAGTTNHIRAIVNRIDNKFAEQVAPTYERPLQGRG